MKRETIATDNVAMLTKRELMSAIILAGISAQSATDPDASANEAVNLADCLISRLNTTADEEARAVIG